MADFLLARICPSSQTHIYDIYDRRYRQQRYVSVREHNNDLLSHDQIYHSILHDLLHSCQASTIVLVHLGIQYGLEL